MHVIRNHLDGVQRHPVLFGDLGQQFLKPHVNRRRHNRTAVFRAPHKVMLERKHRSSVLCLPRISHAEGYKPGSG
jgi:hypothetical protein